MDAKIYKQASLRMINIETLKIHTHIYHRKSHKTNWVWWHTSRDPSIPVVEKGGHEFEANLSYIDSVSKTMTGMWISARVFVWLVQGLD